MGRSYKFECLKCGYRTLVSGGDDSGAMVVLRTIHCRDCRALYDAVIEAKLPIKASTVAAALASKALQKRPATRPTSPPKLALLINRLQMKIPGRMRWQNFPLACPVSTRHRIAPWKTPGKCPKCGAFMDQGVSPFRVWD